MVGNTGHTLEEISSVFLMLRHGVVSQCQMIGRDVSLTIDIAHLAQLIDPGYLRLLLTVHNMEEPLFRTRPRDLNEQARQLSDLAEIFKPELEILDSEAMDNSVTVHLDQHAADCEHCGGQLKFVATSVSVLDQAMKLYSNRDLQKLSDAFWER